MTLVQNFFFQLKTWNRVVCWSLYLDGLSLSLKLLLSDDNLWNRQFYFCSIPTADAKYRTHLDVRLTIVAASSGNVSLSFASQSFSTIFRYTSAAASLLIRSTGFTWKRVGRSTLDNSTVLSDIFKCFVHSTFELLFVHDFSDFLWSHISNGTLILFIVALDLLSSSVKSKENISLNLLYSENQV